MNPIDPNTIDAAREARRRAYAEYQRSTRAWHAAKDIGRQIEADALVQPMRAAYRRYELVVIHHNAVMELPCPEEA
ncbi:MAG: hypothetical protein EYC70_07085 [Planctomycetota bacterium]|nr:MAG: hypothetical protein EYC70_07085 [Planctomycetota bacterium]